MPTQDANKRIAKNTLLLYVRMLFMMAVSLYTSRVVLATLGVEDYGVYNVVGGVVAMFGFINGAMASATQRYITFALGRGDQARLGTVFATTLQIHALIAALVVALGETVGLWFLYTQMQIPDGRMAAAFWVLQCSVFSTVALVLSVPYNADIVAHEKMSAFAYISVLETVLKLAIVYLLVVSPFDKLILYAVLLLVVQVVIRFCYSVYCNRHFPETIYRHAWDGQLFREMAGFAGWSLFGNLSAVLYTQGLNMLLNVFFGPVVNAARAVAVQVQTAIQQFVGNFQMALNPQITKTYAQGDIQAMRRLMFRSARFSYYLLFLLSLPVLFETETVLGAWLKTVPADTVTFLRLMVCTSLIYTLSNPMVIANQATGKVRKYQVVCGSTLIMILPISYACLKLGMPAYSVFVVHLVMEGVAQLARMVMLRPLTGVRIRDYLRNIHVRVAAVTALAAIPPLALYLSIADVWARFFSVCGACVLSVSVATYAIGLTGNERKAITAKAVNIVRKLIKRQTC